MLEACDLECVRGGRRLFAGVGFRLEAGELLALQGDNGSGKTSLLRQLCGLSPPAAGEIRWRGQAIGRLGEDYRRELCFLGHHNAIKEELSPLENLMTTAHMAGSPLATAEALAALAAFGLAGCEDLACRHLSQGQKRRVALARLVHDQHPLWLLDEPFVALDSNAVEHVAALVGSHLRQGGLAVLTTHQSVDIAARQVKELVLAAGERPC